MSTVLETLITDRTAADLANDTDRAYIAYTCLLYTSPSPRD